MTRKIIKQLKQLSTTPGVYQFLDVKKRVIYVGKAANLKNRVRSYFSSFAKGFGGQVKSQLSPAKQQMVDAVTDIKTIATESEIEALLLEANLIKKLQPYYNVTLRDDKSYLYVKISTEEEWPRVFATRKIEKAGTYFGPFTSAHAVREVLQVLRKFLPYRCNQRPVESLQRTDLRSITEVRPPKLRACFWYHLGRCPGTCIGAISKTDYRKIIRRIILFFEGRKKEFARAMRKDMGSERVVLMENVLAHTKVLSVGEKYAGDVRELARVLHLPKAPERIEGYDISNIMGQEATGSMVVFVNGEQAKSEYKRFKIKTVRGANDVRMLEEVLTRRLRHSQLSVVSCQLLDLWPLPDLIIVDGGKAQLNAAVRTIEQCKNSIPENHAIARFSGRMLQVLEKKMAEKFTIVKKSATTFIPVIAVAKGGHGGVLRQKEEIYFPGEKKALKLPNNSPALHLILRVRDEAHRFAVGYHKKLRRNRSFAGLRMTKK